jgi:hypothetical protein
VNADGSKRPPSVSKLVAEGLADGRLWILEEAPVWVGRGTLKPCVVCRLRIGAADIQYDLPGSHGTVPAHATCYRIWRTESDARRKKARKTDPPA